MTKKVLLIVNPCAGKMQVQGSLLQIVKTLCEADYSVSVHVTRRRKDATEVVKARGAEYDLLVACGGDGTLNEVVSGALDIRYGGEVGFLPAGSTNDLAQTLGLPKTLTKACQLLTTGEGKPMDFGKFNRNVYFTYIASFGAFTEVSYSTDQKLKNAWGHFAYVAEGINSLGRVRPYRMRVTVDGETFTDDLLFGAVANAITIGGTLKLNPSEVDLADGMHEILLIRDPKKPGDLTATLMELLAGNYKETGEHVQMLRGRKMTLECDEAVPWCLDGEFAGDVKKAVIETIPRCLRVIRP